MTARRALVPLLTLVALAGPPAQSARAQGAAGPLTIASAGPTGEIGSLEEANEVRVTFSEPMVTLGRIPSPVSAPFFSITPAVPGTFRWSGTRTLIFTPDPKRKLPFATRYEVTIAASAAAVSGRRLVQPYRFSFTTPTARLLSTNWYRRGGRADAPVVVLLRFNQRVRPDRVLAHLQAAFEPHDWAAPALPAAAVERMRAIDPASVDRFNAKVEATRTVASAHGPVSFRLAKDWDKKAFPPAPDLVVLESVSPVPSESWVRLVLDERVPSPAGSAVPGTPQEYTVQVEPAFFVDGFHCGTGCNPEWRNPVLLRREVKVTDFANAVSIADITSGTPQPVTKAETPRPREEYEGDEGAHLTIEDAGFDSQPPARTYAVAVGGDLRAVDGQTLGYTWVGIVENWHESAFVSFGDGHGVWEAGGGLTLPFYGRNMQSVRQWTKAVTLPELMPTLTELQPSFRQAPPGQGSARRLGGAPDRILSHGLDLAGALEGRPTGLVWAAVEEGEPIARASTYDEKRVRASIVQVTNLGITVKDSPLNTLVLVTRLDTGEPVGGARVSIVQPDNRIFWTGMTGADGVAIAPDTPLRDDNYWRFAFIVTAEKDGDVAYVGSDWHEGIEPWEFGTRFDLNEAAPPLRGSVFSDRGVYRLGEEVRIKAILRHSAHDGVRLLPQGTRVFASLRDSQDRLVDERTVVVNEWSSAEWQVALPENGSLGHYQLRVMLETDRPKPRTADQLRPWETPGGAADRYVPYTKVVNGSFLVAAYRRPDFRVDVTLSGGTLIAGDDLQGTVTARYLFGAQMGERPLKWSLTKNPAGTAPPAVLAAFPEDRWHFVGWPEEYWRHSGEVGRDETLLTPSGERTLTLPTKRDAGFPYAYTFEADVEDISRQHIANRATVVVHPAPWYIGLRKLPYFVEQKAGVKTDVVAVSPEGQIRAGVPVTVTLTQIQWISVRRAEGNGFYTWDTERKEVPAGSWTLTTGEEPVPLAMPLPNGGYFELEAVAREADGRHAITRTSFYALGDGYTAWARFDHNRIELVPERKTYQPGETARVMIQSPWEQATALVTTEREGVRTHRQFTLRSTQQSVEVPITAEDIPNVYVSVLLVRGRTPVETPAGAEATGNRYHVTDTSDPGKPAFRLGYVELRVEDASKRLDVQVTANREEYRPANTATVKVAVKDREGRGSASEVTLWAVDYGVLSLTGYRAPDVATAVYAPKALQVMNTDSRQRIVSRRVLTPKGASEGGGGGADAGAGTLRKDFRVLAFWLGSVATDAEGRASVDVQLPESLTTYRIMAVAGDRGSRFGSGSAEVRINKPLTLKPTFPRFLAVGDHAHFGAVVTNQLPNGGAATVTIRSLDPDVLAFGGDTEHRIELGANASGEARFDARGVRIGRARVQMTVRMGDESDAFEDIIPVEILASPETVAAYGEAGDTPAQEKLTVPAGAVPGFGGLQVELSSTALVGLGEGARYLVEYPYGCAEQRASRTLAMVLATDLGEAFSLPGIEPGKLRTVAQENIRELEAFQCPSGGFAFWKGNCLSVSPYLTSYVLHVFKTSSDLKYAVDPGVRERAYAYLERELREEPPANEGWWPSYTAWQAFAVKVLTEGGRNQDSNLTRLYGYRDRMPVFALAYLHDAIAARPGGPATDSQSRLDDLRRRMMNAVLPEGGSAHVEELSDPYLLWFWNSNVRSTAIVLNTLAEADVPHAPYRELVRWLLAARTDGRWRNTQENAVVLAALVSYYRRHEAVTPDFRAAVSLGARELAVEEFRGRTTEATSHSLPMADLLSRAKAGTTEPLTFRREGTGTLFYTARLRYAADELFQEGLDSGIFIERSYAPFVEQGERPAATTYKAGDLVRVTLRFQLTKERRYLAVTDPLPAGFEPVESWFQTTAAALASAQDRQGEDEEEGDRWSSWWRRGGFDHVERHDDRVNLFATRLAEGTHEFSYIVRATTAGTFRTAPARGEEMYEPEVFGRTATTIIQVE